MTLISAQLATVLMDGGPAYHLAVVQREYSRVVELTGNGENNTTYSHRVERLEEQIKNLFIVDSSQSIGEGLGVEVDHTDNGYLILADRHCN